MRHFGEGVAAGHRFGGDLLLEPLELKAAFLDGDAIVLARRQPSNHTCMAT